jgi:hypothetical protein
MNAVLKPALETAGSDESKDTLAHELDVSRHGLALKIDPREYLGSAQAMEYLRAFRKLVEERRAKENKKK